MSADASDARSEPEEPSSEHAAPPMKDLPGIAAFAAMGMSVAVIVAIGVVGGLWVDRALGTAPGGLILGIVLSTVTAVVSVLKQVRRFL